MNILQQVIYKTRYAKWIPEHKRREHWPETVHRFMEQLQRLPNLAKKGHHGSEVVDNSTKDAMDEVESAILSLEVMPSMRALMTAGPALDREHIAAYNCAYLTIKSKRDFAEVLYILMNGTGVGFSVERQYINLLPTVPNELKEVEDVIVVQDSKLGWAKAFNKLVNSLYEGDIPKVDYSRIRPAGARLRTFGGRASGPDPLRQLFTLCVQTFRGAQGRKLSSIEIHDLVCTIGEVVVVGGVRRSALISLSNLTDRRMREAKSGAWWEESRCRALANNSVAYTETPDSEAFLEEWLHLIKSKSGERGIFNRVAARRQASRGGRRSASLDYGCNPCSEIILRDKQFCNLTEVVVRSSDTLDDIKRKVRIATILGTLQSTFTDFGFISEEWRRNCEEERLLGVSLTGIYDNPFLNGSSGHIHNNNDRSGGMGGVANTTGSGTEAGLAAILQQLKEVAIETNKEWAKKLGIPPSAAITCVKPSGTVSQLVDSASGIHPRYAPFYIRNVRMDKKDPVSAFLRTAGIPNEPDASFPESQVVFSFPCKAPAGAVCRGQVTALDHLTLWKIYQDDYCEHKPSVTISVKEKEWPSVGGWVYDHFEEISGVSFLPYSDHTYKQAPFIEITEEQYKEMAVLFPKELSWETLVEAHDETTASQELACTGNTCEI